MLLKVCGDFLVFTHFIASSKLFVTRTSKL